MSQKNICPVCGFSGLKEPPYSQQNEPSYEVCPCCGFESGFDDGNLNSSCEALRKKWIGAGAEWFVPSKKPPGWDLNQQLENT